MPNRKVMAVR